MNKIELFDSIMNNEEKRKFILEQCELFDLYHEKGTKGDHEAKRILNKILKEGRLDLNPRPHYEDKYDVDSRYDQVNRVFYPKDGEKIVLKDNQIVKEFDDRKEIWTPAHTISYNHEMCTYDLSKGESPLWTLRAIPTKSAFAELIWIYSKQSSDLVDFDEILGKNTWELNGEINNWWKDWAVKDSDGKFILNEDGHPDIYNCYGGTIGPRHLTEQLINGLIDDPDGRRHIICMWQYDDFKKKHGLKPCAFLTNWNVRHEANGDYLDMCLYQRSSDFCTAGSINQFQYVMFLEVIAKITGYIPGKFTWFADNIQIYDRHINQAKELISREGIDCSPKVEIFNTDFFKLTTKDYKLTGYPLKEIEEKNKQLKFQLGI